MTTRTTLIGIDCATQDNKVGVARGSLKEGIPEVEEAFTCSREKPLHQTLCIWIAKAQRALLAIDAPLGWPDALGRTVATHSAGDPIAEDGNTLFRRHTDRFVKEQVGQQSLDVGADRIARTALAALVMLSKLRDATQEVIPLAWTPDFETRVAAIEVYPAATLKVRGVPTSSYKKENQLEARRTILASLSRDIRTASTHLILESQPDALDAAICVLAAADFLRGAAFRPADRALASKEGWIWVKTPSVPLGDV